jgi:putative OPT family oligopeptide transporter
VTDLKTGYWLGSTPREQQWTKFLGCVVAAAAAALTIAMLARAFQFGEATAGDMRVVLPAPQASIMKSLVEGFLSQQPVAYILFGSGAVLAVIMEMLGVPALIFALGMYLPLELNTPALVGGFLVHFLNKRAETRGAHVRERGIVIASGLMAGGALGGVFGASLRLIPGFSEDWLRSPFYGDEAVSQAIALLLFVSLGVYVWRTANRKEPEAAGSSVG